ncbi:hypothetical protein ACLB2K_026400 [Fragaria x ananassa]
MTKPIYGRFTYGTETILLPLCSGTTYEELLAKVSSRFQYIGGRFVFRYALTDCSNCHLECDDDISVMLDIFSMLNSPFIDIYVLDIGCSSKSCIDEEIHVVVMPATTVTNASEDVPLHVAKANLSSDDSNYEDVDNMVIGNFVSNKSKRKYISSEWSEYINKIGQVFVGEVVQVCNREGFLFDYAKNDNLRVSASCSKKEYKKCEWYIYASIEKASCFFVVRKLVNTHSCLGIVRHEKHKKRGSKVISSIIVDKVKSDPLIKPTYIVKNFKEEYGLVIPYYMAYRGKGSANYLFNGSEALGYALLPWYIDALKRSNPDSYCILDSIEEIFQFAFAVVDAETKENWNWFLEHLAIILMTDYRNIVFMSDHGHGLLDGVKEVGNGRNWRVSQSSVDVFEVYTEDSNDVVNLAEMECSYGWRLFQCFPCSHAVQVMQKANRLPYHYIEDYWKTSFYRSAHNQAIILVPDRDKPNPSSLGDSALQPPITRKPPGRPKTRKIMSFGEEARPMQCQRCHQLGHHNIKSCTTAI